MTGSPHIADETNSSSNEDSDDAKNNEGSCDDYGDDWNYGYTISQEFCLQKDGPVVVGR